MKAIFAIFFYLFPLDVYSKPIIHTTEQFIERAAINTDTIFVGKVLEKKEIDDGFTLNNVSSPIGVLKVEVLKVYRGGIKEHEHRFVCTWFDRKEHPFTFAVGQEFTFFGINTSLNIQLPSTLGFIFAPTVFDRALTKALQLPSRPIKDQSLIFEFVESGDNITRNVCNESNAWQLQMQDSEGRLP
ncbi:hypothetical protein [Methylomonas koyamae]|uniref:hypothetical protein n=1 Tax=Methylomonas koyamae TaxID=702114 RepID=UPI002873719D|nr:hypothetical protein [Methylomonas koyamae]WNB75566.1 hypothetical protein RI210_20155 [Methylomonas koyamae]